MIEEVEENYKSTNFYKQSPKLSSSNDIINLHDHTHSLSREFNGRSTDQKRLDNVLLQNITDRSLYINPQNPYLSHIDTSSLLPKSMSVTQLSYDPDWIQPCVLSQRTRDNLQGLGISLEAVGLHSRKSFPVLGKLMRELDLWSSSSGDKSSLLDKTTNNTQRIVQTTLSFLENKSVCSVDDNTDSLGRGLGPRDLDDICSTLGVSLFNKLSSSKLVLSKRLDISNWLTSSRLE